MSALGSLFLALTVLLFLAHAAFAWWCILSVCLSILAAGACLALRAMRCPTGAMHQWRVMDIYGGEQCAVCFKVR